MTLVRNRTAWLFHAKLFGAVAHTKIRCAKSSARTT
jgi:hypothetical protein